nr:12628_t:CDS:1 [Entrophospora candida]
MIFLKPSKSQSSTVYFPPDKIEQAQQNSVRKIVEDLIKNSSTRLEEVKNYDVYILRVNSSHEGAGPSSGVAHYLALYSALNKIPLPKNLASTATIEGQEVGAIGGLQHKLAASVGKGINTFILAKKNESSQNKEESFDDTPTRVVEKIKQVHFISQVSQIETALLEIMTEPDKHVFHSCGANPPEKPRRDPGNNGPNNPPNPNSSITPDQLLSLEVEVFSQDVSVFPKDQQDFKRKLMGIVMENDNHYKAVEDVIELRKKYLQKIQAVEKENFGIDEAKEKAEIDKLEQDLKDLTNELVN